MNNDKPKRGLLVKVFLGCFALLWFFMGFRIALGDIYNLNDSRTFVCSHFLCMRQGQQVDYKDKYGHIWKKYFCEEHPAEQKIWESGSDSMFEEPNIFASILFVAFPLFSLSFFCYRGFIQKLT